MNYPRQHTSTSSYPSDERARQARGNGGTAQPKTKGHDAVLSAIQAQGREATIILLSGDVVTGKIVGRDKYTITVRVDLKTVNNATRREVIYKSAIERFWADETPSQSE